MTGQKIKITFTESFSRCFHMYWFMLGVIIFKIYFIEKETKIIQDLNPYCLFNYATFFFQIMSRVTSPG